MLSKFHKQIEFNECKYCSKCENWKPLDAYNKNRTIWDGLERRCRACAKLYRNDTYTRAQQAKTTHLNRKPHRIREEEEKHCFTCKRWKGLDKFAHNRTIWDGLDRKCRDCTREYRVKNKAKLALAQKEYRETHKQERKIWLEANASGLKLYNQDYGKAYRKDNQEVLKSYFAKHFQENKATIYAKAKERRDNDPTLCLLYNLRCRINKALKYDIKSARTKELLACSIDNLKTHLESQFEEGMTFENNTLDGWHVDHIIPCAYFDMSNPVHQLRCFNYRNLQPLWAKDNLSKSSKMSPEADTLLKELEVLFPTLNYKDGQ